MILQTADHLYTLAGAHLELLERFKNSNPSGGEAADRASEFLADVNDTVERIRKHIEEAGFDVWQKRALGAISVLLEDRVAEVRKLL